MQTDKQTGSRLYAHVAPVANETHPLIVMVRPGCVHEKKKIYICIKKMRSFNLGQFFPFLSQTFFFFLKGEMFFKLLNLRVGVKFSTRAIKILKKGIFVYIGVAT